MRKGKHARRSALSREDAGVQADLSALRDHVARLTAANRMNGKIRPLHPVHQAAGRPAGGAA